MSEFLQNNSELVFAFVNGLFLIVVFPLLKAWLTEKIGEQRAAKVETAVQSGLNAAIQSATDGKSASQTIKAVINDPTVRNTVVEEASAYVRETVPGAVDKLNIDPALEKIVAARVDEAIARLAERMLLANKAVTSVEKAATGEGSGLDATSG